MLDKAKMIYREYRKLYRMSRYSNMDPSEYPNELKKIYKQMTGVVLDLDNPTRYTEKIQWKKIYGMRPEHSMLADKYAVREWVAERVSDDYLIPCIGVWDSFEEIDFEKVPDKFVLKTTNGCGTHLIVSNKKDFDIKSSRKRVNSWMKQKYEFANGFEMQYAPIKPQIIIEELIEAPGGLKDYKFLCFNGKVYCLYITSGREGGHEAIQMGIVDRDYNLMPYTRKGLHMMRTAPSKPINYDEMIEVAEKLAAEFSHVRVDLYNVEGKIYFGEMTFTGAGGYGMFEPDEFDYILGNLWEIKNDAQL